MLGVNNRRFGVRLVENDDCASCADSKLAECCSFRYEDIPASSEEMISRPELVTMSPLGLYIGGLMTIDEVRALPRNRREYYCMGSNTDGGCGTHDGQFPCRVEVDDRDRNKVSSNTVSRFTFEDLVRANGGPRDPKKKFSVIRHAAIHISSRVPSEAEITFYTLLWRHQETATKPVDRILDRFGGNKRPIESWRFMTNGTSRLLSKLHGIDCGDGGESIPSCRGKRLSKEEVCKSNNCGVGATCINVDGEPLCMCRDGLVGDGVVCTFESETSYELHPSAHGLASRAVDRECFPSGNVWPTFVKELDLPPYPGGMAPFSVMSCGSSVCRPGWLCDENRNECIEPTGKDMCEGYGYTKEQCDGVGCCKYRNGGCKSKNKYRSTACPPPGNKQQWTCSDLESCCYWPCRRLTDDRSSGREQIGQVGNCGLGCQEEILADINGVKHPQLFLLHDGYRSNGTFHSYESNGPLQVDGSNKNMYKRCLAECFDSPPPPSQDLVMACFEGAKDKCGCDENGKKCAMKHIRRSCPLIPTKKERNKAKRLFKKQCF